MERLNRLNVFFICASVFFLPIDINLNNIFLFLFILLSFFLFFTGNKAESVVNIKSQKITLFVASLPFLLNALGLIYTEEVTQGIDYTVRSLPFLFIPLIAASNPSFFVDNYKKIGYSLVAGCLFVSLWSWFFSIQALIDEGKSFKELFGPLYSNHRLLRHLDMHAAYVSVFIYTAIGFFVTQFKHYKKRNRIMFGLIIAVLFLFMCHLLSRTALMYFLFSSGIYLIYQRQWKVIFVLSVFVASGLFYAYNTPHNYLRDRLFNNLNFFEKKTQFSKKDDRFDRLAASYEIFKERPFIGYGTAGESKYRREIYKRNRDRIAYENNYNAHNQFFEYLSTYGFLGGIVFMAFFAYLFHLAYKLKNRLIAYVVIGLFMFCMTESVFERSWGVVYASVIIAFMVALKAKRKPQIIHK